jgi:hypothetical protein
MDELFVHWVKEHQEFLETLREEGYLNHDLIQTINEALSE